MGLAAAPADDKVGEAVSEAVEEAVEEAASEEGAWGLDLAAAAPVWAAEDAAEDPAEVPVEEEAPQDEVQQGGDAPPAGGTDAPVTEDPARAAARAEWRREMNRRRKERRSASSATGFGRFGRSLDDFLDGAGDA